MRFLKKTTAFVLVSLFAFSLLAGGSLSLFAFAEDDFIESPILPIVPSAPDPELGIVYLFDEETMTAKIIDFTDLQAKYVVIPDLVPDGEKNYAVTSIASAAFSAASSLEHVVIPETVKTIEIFAFDACTKLENVWYEGDKASFVQISIADGNEALIHAEIHYGACMKSEGPDDFSHTYDDYKDADCNACRKSRSLAENFVAGDVNNSGVMDLDDAIYLLFHVNFPDRYPVNQSSDFDNSGSVDIGDVFHLLYHINFPDRYPIA